MVMMRPVRSPTWVAAVAAVVLVMVVPSIAGAAASSTSSAESADSLIAVDLGGDSVSLVTDSISIDRNGSRIARAALTLLSANGTDVGEFELEADETSDNDSEGAATEETEVTGLVALEPSEGEISVEVLASRVTSTVIGTLGAADVLEGLVSVDGGTVQATTHGDADDARAERSLTIDSIEMLELGALLDALGVDPLSLACDAVEETGGLLGADTAGACEELAEAEGAIGDVPSVFGAAAGHAQALLDEIQADADAVEAIADGLDCGVVDLACVTDALATIEEASDTYELGLLIPDPLDVLADPDPAGLLEGLAGGALDGIQPYLDAATAGDGALDGAIAALGETCASVAEAASDAAEAIDELVGTFTGLDAFAGDVADLTSDGAAVGALASSLDAACAALQGMLDALLDTTLLTLGGVDIEMSVIARENDPEATITGEIGSVMIGSTEPVEAPVDLSDGEELEGTLAGALEAVTDALGIGLPAPELEFLALDTDAGELDGAWFAEASATGVRLGLPSATLEVPDEDPLGILDGGFEIDASVGPTPEIEVRAAAFDGSAEFSPDATNGGTQRETLPRTGTGDEPIAGIGALLLVMASLAPTLVRRILRGAE